MKQRQYTALFTEGKIQQRYNRGTKKATWKRNSFFQWCLWATQFHATCKLNVQHTFTWCFMYTRVRVSLASSIYFARMHLSQNCIRCRKKTHSLLLLVFSAKKMQCIVIISGRMMMNDELQMPTIYRELYHAISTDSPNATVFTVHPFY